MDISLLKVKCMEIYLVLLCVYIFVIGVLLIVGNIFYHLYSNSRYVHFLMVNTTICIFGWIIYVICRLSYFILNHLL